MALLSIDFGTSYCAAAWLSPVSGKPEAISFGMGEFNNEKHYKFPSAIIYAKDKDNNESKIVGEKAYADIIGGDIENSCYKIKTELTPGKYRIINGKEKTFPEIVGDLFAEVKSKATQMTNQENDYFDEVVITHPANFEYKELLFKAAEVAGWQKDKVKFLEEPIAAAYGFSINQSIPDNSGLIVFDYGGGTIDVAYLFKSNKELKWYFPPKGESKCGGEYIDILLHNHFRKESHTEDKEMIDFKLLNKCRKIKIAFSDLKINEEEVLMKNIAYKLSREKFEEIISTNVDRAIKVFENVVKECVLREKPIDYILLNGGSSKLDLVRKRIINMGYPKEKLLMFEGEDIAVALGGIASMGKIISSELSNNDGKEEESSNTPVTLRNGLKDIIDNYKSKQI